MQRSNPEPNSKADLTNLLEAIGLGDDEAMARLMPRVYDELKAVARRQLRLRRPGETLDTTALVHEAYMKLADHSQPVWKDRIHFFSVAALAMRQLLLDNARQKMAKKRGGGEIRVPLEEGRAGGGNDVVEILALDTALQALTELNPRLGRIVELRFFGGLSVAEIARHLESSESTIKRDWRKARAFLHRYLRQTG